MTNLMLLVGPKKDAFEGRHVYTNPCLTTQPRASRERTRGEKPGDSGPPVYVSSARDLEQSEEEEEERQRSDQASSYILTRRTPWISGGNSWDCSLGWFIT